MITKTNTRSVLILGAEIKDLTNFLKNNNEELEYIYLDIDQYGDVVYCSIETKAKSDLSGYKCIKEYRKTIEELDGSRAIAQTLSDKKPQYIKYTQIDN